MKVNLLALDKTMTVACSQVLPFLYEIKSKD